MNKEKRIGEAINRFKSNEATASRAARITGIPLTSFLDILQQQNISLHYTLETPRSFRATSLALAESKPGSWNPQSSSNFDNLREDCEEL